MIRERPWIVLVALVLAFAGWYGIWHSLMASDVARIRATIEYHNQAFKESNQHIELRADKVSATGFPFSFRVKVMHPTLSLIWARETLAVSLPSIELQEVSSSDGRYKLLLPPSFDALYAESGSAPEKYSATLSAVPKVLLRAQGSSMQCPNMPGMRSCPPVADDAPLITFAAELPEEMTLTVKLNDQSKDIAFKFHPVGIPIFLTIPKDAASPLQVFVGMLREAMIYNGKNQ